MRDYQLYPPDKFSKRLRYGEHSLLGHQKITGCTQKHATYLLYPLGSVLPAE